MYFLNNYIYLAMTAGLLAGCMGGGDAVTPEPAPTFNELALELSTSLDQDGFGADLFSARNDPASLPASGSATYNGVVSVLIYEASETSLGDDLEILGDLNISADFGSDSISGGARDFSDSDGGTYAGQLNITGDIRNNPPGTEVTILGRIGGTLVHDQSGADYIVQAAPGYEIFGEGAILAGDFYGADNSVMYGVIRGAIDTPEGTLLIWDNNDAGIPDGDGIFIAER